jgi:hypothetical protein
MLGGMFTDEYRNFLLQKYRGRPSWHRPEVWVVATAPERDRQRAWLNQTIDSLPEPGKSKAMRRLPENAHFLSTYSELSAAAILVDAGLSVEYEPDLGKRTPDFVVDGKAGPCAIVEVYTKFRSEAQRHAEGAWKVLHTRVRDIPVPVVLVVNSLGGTSAEAPDEATSKRIATKLRSWLLRTPEDVGREEVFEGYHFMIGGQAPGLYALMALPGGGGWFDSDMVLTAINEKTRRYASLASRMEVPLLVILAAEPASPMNQDLVRSALSGDMSTTLKVDVFARYSEPHTVRMRSDRTPVTFDPALSVIGWLDPGIDSPGELTVFPATSSERPLDLPTTESLHVVSL